MSGGHGTVHIGEATAWQMMHGFLNLCFLLKQLHFCVAVTMESGWGSGDGTGVVLHSPPA